MGDESGRPAVEQRALAQTISALQRPSAEPPARDPFGRDLLLSAGRGQGGRDKRQRGEEGNPSPAPRDRGYGGLLPPRAHWRGGRPPPPPPPPHVHNMMPPAGSSSSFDYPRGGHHPSHSQPLQQQHQHHQQQQRPSTEAATDAVGLKIWPGPDVCPFPIKTFAQFSEQSQLTGPAAHEKYREYVDRQTLVWQQFVYHNKEAWFRRLFHPQALKARDEQLLENLPHRAQVISELLRSFPEHLLPESQAPELLCSEELRYSRLPTHLHLLASARHPELYSLFIHGTVPFTFSSDRVRSALCAAVPSLADSLVELSLTTIPCMQPRPQHGWITLSNPSTLTELLSQQPFSIPGDPEGPEISLVLSTLCQPPIYNRPVLSQFSTPDRFFFDAQQCQQLITKLEAQRHFCPSLLAELEDIHPSLQGPHPPQWKRLCLLASYLRSVHLFCYFCARQFSSPIELFHQCGIHHLPLPEQEVPAAAATVNEEQAKSEEEPGEALENAEECKPTTPSTGAATATASTTAAEAQLVLSRFDRHIEYFLSEQYTPREYTGEALREAIENEWTAANFQMINDSRFKCLIPNCPKQFLSEQFMQKHLTTMHANLLESAMGDLDGKQFFFNLSHRAPLPALPELYFPPPPPPQQAGGFSRGQMPTRPGLRKHRGGFHPQ